MEEEELTQQVKWIVFHSSSHETDVDWLHHGYEPGVQANQQVKDQQPYRLGSETYLRDLRITSPNMTAVFHA